MRTIGLIAAITLTTSGAAGEIAAQQPAVWRLIPEVRIEHPFRDITGVVIAPDSSVFVADRVAREVNVFKRGGAHGRRVGGDRGIVSFDQIRGVGLLADTLWVIDAGVTDLYSLEGKRLASVGTDRGAFLTTLLPGDSALGINSAPFGSGREFRDDSVAVVLATRSGRIMDTIAWTPSKNANLALVRPEGGFTVGRQLFSDAGLTITVPGGRVFFVVDRAVAIQPDSAAFRVAALRTNGDTLWVRSYRYTPRRIEKTRLDSLWNAIEPGLLRSGHAPEAIRRAVFLPEYYTPITSGVAARDGSLWLRRENDQSNGDYWVMGSDGAHKATVTVPSNVTLMAVTDDDAWGVEKSNALVSLIRFRIGR